MPLTITGWGTASASTRRTRTSLAADLDAIEAEWPLIEAELGVLDAEIAALTAPAGAVVAGLATDAPRSSTAAHCACAAGGRRRPGPVHQRHPGRCRVIPGRHRPLPALTPAEVARFYRTMLVAGHGMVWGGETNNNGYGRFPIWRDGKRVRLLAHRVSFMLATGKDPGHLVIRHACDTPPCCTPDCFLPGTQAENIRDAIIRHRLNTDGLSVFRAVRIAQTAARTGADRKLCTWCGRTHRLADFEIAPSNPDGRAYWCRECAAGHQFMPTRVAERARLQQLARECL